MRLTGKCSFIIMLFVRATTGMFIRGIGGIDRVVHLIKYNLKIFLNSRVLCISFFVMLTACITFLIEKMQWITASNFAEYLTASQNLGIIGFIFFSFVSYDFLSNCEVYKFR